MPYIKFYVKHCPQKETMLFGNIVMFSAHCFVSIVAHM